MDDIFLVEIRLARTKWRISEMIFGIADSFRVKQHMERHPHITLFGPLILKEGYGPRTLLAAIGRVAYQFTPVPYLIDGFEEREGMHGSVIAFPVLPSDSLRELTSRIAEELSGISVSKNAWDERPEKKWFHVTIANLLTRKKASEIFAALTSPVPVPGPRHVSPRGIGPRILSVLTRVVPFRKQPVHFFPPLIDDTGLRITVMRGQRIFAEYDLVRRRWIRDAELKDIRSWQETLSWYRRQAGFELVRPAGPSGEETFVIADLHFGHANIIRYCSRPFLFSDAGVMDKVLIRNWNCTVGPGNRVYVLGDLRYGSQAPPARQYLKNLQGSVTFIQGNHDSRDLGAVPNARIDHDGIRFLLVHDPADAPGGFDGWVIHGHHHNNDLRSFPFVNFTERRINVSAEVTGYTPVGLGELCTLIRNRQATGNTDPVLLRYPCVR
jgi:calcineurin-like phosphoesterase family protein